MDMCLSNFYVLGNTINRFQLRNESNFKLFHKLNRLNEFAKKNSKQAFSAGMYKITQVNLYKQNQFAKSFKFSKQAIQATKL